jgi:hypothetical protein
MREFEPKLAENSLGARFGMSALGVSGDLVRWRGIYLVYWVARQG